MNKEPTKEQIRKLGYSPESQKIKNQLLKSVRICPVCKLEITQLIDYGGSRGRYHKELREPSQDMVEKVARIILACMGNDPDFVFEHKDCDTYALKDVLRTSTNAADEILALIKAPELKWQDIPDKGGEWWLSAFVDNSKYISPRIMRVIDYERKDRGLEVDSFGHDSIPADIFVKEYYPKAKWLFIPEPTTPRDYDQQQIGGKK